LNRLTETLFERDSENKKYRVIKKIKKNICKNFINKKKRFVISNPRRIRIFAVCHPNELHFALGLCRKCYWKQYRDNAPPAICHPNKKIFRKNLCKPCYRKLHPEKKINEN
jgi:hypothetical protein